MHTVMIVMALLSALLLRCFWCPKSLNYTQRCQRTLFYFLFPPMFLLMTAMAVFGMGTQGKMLGMETGYFSYGLSGLFLLSAIAQLGGQALRQWRNSTLKANITTIGNHSAYLLPVSIPYSAQVGWWQSHLVVSEGLLSILDTAHLEAVIAHEKAHLHYRDTFWFFWLGWLHRTTLWLPNSRSLFQELLLLRELRADWKAAQTVDPLLLAEALVTVAKYEAQYPEVGGEGLSCTASKSRLEERIEALINQEEIITPPLVRVGGELVWAFTPLVTVPWHHC